MTRLCFLVLAASVAQPVLAQRLPDTVIPLHYDITVAPDLAAAKFTGEETIRVRLAKPTSTIVLNAAEITFDEVTVRAGARTEKATVTLDPSKEQATFTLPSSPVQGDAEIHIRYTGILNDDLRGLYLSKANNRRYAVTQLEATDARRMFPSFDEPALKASFALTAIIDAGDSAISNGRVLSDTPGPGAGKHTLKFEQTPKMSTYLVALAVGDFVCNEGAVDGIPIRICSTPEKKGLTRFALESAQEVVKFYNRYYSIKYPFKKLDVVAVPDFAAGAMENTAAIFYRETLLLADDSASVGTRKAIAGVLAHEIAHQWFGDLVTMRWWDDLWLNEGFANWMQTKPVKAWKPEWQVELDEVQGNQVAMNLDGLQSTRTIRAKAETPAEINELFDPIAYEKGAAVLRMVEQWVGEEAFRTGVNAYVEKYQYGNARAEDFWSTLAKSTGKPVDRVMETFVDQPGVPLVSAELKCGGSGDRAQVVLTQERYLRDPTAKPAAQLWQIPVCLRGSSGRTVCDVMDERRESIAVEGCPTWLISNAGARGYYRTASSPDAVRRMSDYIAPLTPAERMALVSDEWALVRANRHDIGVFLDLAGGFRAERSADVLQTLTGSLAIIGEDIVSASTRSKFRSWVAALLNPVLQEVGFAARPNDTDETRALRATVVRALGETARDPAVLAKARELVLQELDKPGSVEPTLLNVIAQLAALEGDAALYERYLAAGKSATNPEDKYRYLYGLASFGNPALVRRTFEFILSPDVRAQDARIFLGAQLSSPDGRELGWDLIQQHWDELHKKDSTGMGYVVGALSAFCDAAAAGEIRTFFAKNKVPEAERTLQQTLERVGSCARFAAAQRPKLDAWFAGR
ncbi:MAG: M1 family metallopeptidase [Vicinamibacterales bacterium]